MTRQKTECQKNFVLKKWGRPAPGRRLSEIYQK